MNLRKAASNWQGLWSGIAALGIFFGLPYVIEWAFPTDTGFAPGAYVQVLALAFVFFFGGSFAAWLLYAMDFKAFDSELDKRTVCNLYESIQNPAVKLCTLILPYFLLLCYFTVCLVVAGMLVLF